MWSMSSVEVAMNADGSFVRNESAFNPAIFARNPSSKIADYFLCMMNVSQ